MTDRVWIADVFGSSSWPLFVPLQRMRMPEPMDPQEFRRRYVLAERELDAAHFPEAIRWDPDPEYEAWPAKRFPQLTWSSQAKGPAEVQLLGIPDFAYLGRYIIVSDTCRQVLSRFDLGDIQFHPMRVFQADGETEIVGPWFCMVLANKKRALDAAGSRNIRQIDLGKWTDSAGLQDGDVAVSAEALASPAIWIDPAFSGYVFFSDEAHGALKESGCAGVIEDMKVGRVG